MNGKASTDALSGLVSAVVIGIAGSFLFFAAYIVFPPAGLIAGLLASYPAAYFRLKQSSATGVIIVLGTVVLLGAVFNIQAACMYLIQCAAIALLLPELLLKGIGAARSLAWTIVASMAVLVLSAFVFALMNGVNIHEAVVKEISRNVTQTLALYEKAGVSASDLSIFKQSMTMMADAAKRTYPALFALMYLVMAGCNFTLIRKLAVRLGITLNVREFREYKNPETLIWFLIVSGFALLLDEPLVTTVALNLLVVMVTLYFLQGLAVLFTFFERQAFAKYLRFGIYVLMVFQPYVVALIAALGIFDLWGDFRTPRKQENL